MELSNDEKIEVLEKLKKLINTHGGFMCVQVMKVVHKEFDIFEQIPEILKYKPLQVEHYRHSWFRLDDNVSRVRVIENTIDDLKALQA